MKYTAEQVVALPAGQEIDKAVAELLGTSPRVEWKILSPDESGSAASFESKREADEWLAKHKKEIPNTRLSDYHVGRWDYYPFYSRNMSDAWRVVEFFASGKGAYRDWYEMSYRPTGAEANFTGNRRQAGYACFDECENDRQRCQALAIARAALLATITDLRRLPTA